MSGYDSHAVIVKLCVLYNCTKLYKNALIRAVTDSDMVFSGNRVTDFPADIDTDDISVTLMTKILWPSIELIYNTYVQYHFHFVQSVSI